MPNYTVSNTLKLSDFHWKLVEITLYIETHDIRLLWKWHWYPALNGFQKAKSIQCYTRQIMSNLRQRKQMEKNATGVVIHPPPHPHPPKKWTWLPYRAPD